MTVKRKQPNGNPKRSTAHLALRDYFAAEAMQIVTAGALAKRPTFLSWAELAEKSYAIADAMLTARSSSRAGG